MPVGGIDLHFIHEPSRNPEAVPLLISHGGRDRCSKFHKLIPMLTEHFTVIAPSLPGYTLSFKPGQKRFGVEAIADVYAALMTDVLGYKSFGVQGGDWGCFVASVLGHRYPERVQGIHLNMLAVRRDPAMLANPTPDSSSISERGHRLSMDPGHQAANARVRPYRFAGRSCCLDRREVPSWTDNDGNPETAISRDEMLANISLYWFTGAIGSSFWPYYARMHGPWHIPEGQTVDVPTGYAAFPKEILRPPRSVAAKTYTDIRRWSVMPKGGHFAALDSPMRWRERSSNFSRAWHRRRPVAPTPC